MKTVKNKKKSMRDKFEFYSRVYWALYPSTRIVLYTLAGVIIAAVLIAITRDIEKTALIIVSAIAAVVFIKFIIEVFSSVISDIRETASAIRQYPPKKDYSQDAGYKRLMRVLKEAGEEEIAYQLSESLFAFKDTGEYSTPKTCEYQFDVTYPPYDTKWAINIRDNVHGNRFYTE